MIVMTMMNMINMMNMMNMMNMKLFAFVVVLGAVAATATDPYTVSSSNGNFTVNSVTMSTPNGQWTAGATATVVTTGVSNKIILAGVVKYRVYEQFQYHFIASGSINFFQCTNKGCDPTKPIALALENPTSDPSNFTMTFTFDMPAIEAPGNNQFKILFWAEDQDHSPYDMSATISYDLRTSAEEQPSALSTVAQRDPYSKTVQNKFFIVDEIRMTSQDDKWVAGQSAHVHARGHVHNKTITAGTLKYQLWEGYEPHFIASGSADYFHCTIKSCNTADPISLRLKDPSDPWTDFDLDFDFIMLHEASGGDKQFQLVFWGEDQDHSPYDFSATITYNLTSTSY